MTSRDRLVEKRNRLVAQLGQFADAVSGNLSRAAIPPGSDRFYWRITWKEKQRTRIQYVRTQDVDAVRRGIEDFASLKNLLQQIGDINRTLLLSKSTRSS